PRRWARPRRQARRRRTPGFRPKAELPVSFASRAAPLSGSVVRVPGARKPRETNAGYAISKSKELAGDANGPRHLSTNARGLFTIGRDLDAQRRRRRSARHGADRIGVWPTPPVISRRRCRLSMRRAWSVWLLTGFAMGLSATRHRRSLGPR